MPAPKNLTKQAAKDYKRVLDESEPYGAERAAQTLLDLDRICDEIAQGEGLGHERQDVRTEARILFRRLLPTTNVIAYNADTRMVIRILPGPSEFSAKLRGK